jgi:hypothetical protein
MPEVEKLELGDSSSFAAIPRMIGKLFSKTSTPKFTEPQVSVAISGRSASGAARFALR